MLTLSEYFPKGTEYFYSYPIGDTLYFYNAGDPISEELISARLLACAGDDIKVVVYNSTMKDELLGLLQKHSEIPLIKEEQIIVLPPHINEEVMDLKRNELIADALVKQTSPGKLLMAQPMLHDKLIKGYQIDPKLITWLNDKKNLEKYVPHEFLPERYAHFSNGKEFFNSNVKVSLPCVVKISASSAGEGVRMCRTKEDLEQAKKDFRERVGTIFIEKLISYVHNLGFQFGISHDKNLFFPPHIIGHNHQVTASDGEFLGGFIFREEPIGDVEEKIKKVIEKEILPKIQEMGWYGVGGFDVLIDAEGKFYIIDSNFRTTGMTAYIFLTRNNLIAKSMVSFTGIFNGSEKDFVKKVFSLNKGKKKILTIISLKQRRTGEGYRFDAALLFDEQKDLPKLATKLIETGVRSEVLEILAHKMQDMVI